MEEAHCDRILARRDETGRWQGVSHRRALRRPDRHRADWIPTADVSARLHALRPPIHPASRQAYRCDVPVRRAGSRRVNEHPLSPGQGSRVRPSGLVSLSQVGRPLPQKGRKGNHMHTWKNDYENIVAAIVAGQRDINLDELAARPGHDARRSRKLNRPPHRARRDSRAQRLK